MLKRTLLTSPIPRRQKRCSHCQTPFSPGSFYYTLLHTLPSPQGGERFDFCSSCGVSSCTNREEGQAIFWQGRIPTKVEEGPLPALAQHAEAILRELCSCQEENVAEQAFLLALFLVRQRKLAQRYEETTPQGGILLWYEVLASGELLAVPKAVPRHHAAVDLRRLLMERMAG